MAIIRRGAAEPVVARLTRASMPFCPAEGPGNARPDDVYKSAPPTFGAPLVRSNPRSGLEATSP